MHLRYIHTYVQGDKPFKAYQQVIEERPLAAVQIILAIFAVEALGQFNQVTNWTEMQAEQIKAELSRSLTQLRCMMRFTYWQLC